MRLGKWSRVALWTLLFCAASFAYVAHQSEQAARRIAIAEARAVDAERRASQAERELEDHKVALARKAEAQAQAQAEARADLERRMRVAAEAAAKPSSNPVAIPSPKPETPVDLQALAAATLKDPGSAQFRSMELKAGGTVLCGEINAKNSFGGYVGFRPFVTTSSATVIWNGGCPDSRQIDSQIACARESNTYISAAIKNGCKSQQEINANLLPHR